MILQGKEPTECLSDVPGLPDSSGVSVRLSSVLPTPSGPQLRLGQALKEGVVPSPAVTAVFGLLRGVGQPPLASWGAKSQPDWCLA